MDRLGRAWRRYQWPVIGLLALVAVALGFYGALQQDSRPSVVDAFYIDLQLWVAGAPSSIDHWALNVARFLQPLLAGYSTIAAAWVLMHRRVLATRAGFAKGHIVVVGCGRTGLGFVLAARRTGRAVTAVDLSPSNPNIHACNAAGTHVVVGDATDPDTLALARVEHAADLVIVCPNDDVNTTVALQAMALPLRRKLRIAARVRDPSLAQVMRAYQFHCDDRRVVLEVFDLELIAASRLSARLDGCDTVALFGDSPLLDHLVQTNTFSAVTHIRTESRLAALNPPAAVRRADVAIVATGEDGRNLATALLLKESAGESLRVIACMLRTPDVDAAPRLPGIEVFDVVAGVCTPELLDEAMIETLARAVHEAYVEARDDDTESTVGWADLDEALKESNRDQAAHIGTKLRAIGCGIVPGGDTGFAFTGDEVEVLAELEHDRWVAERKAHGWTPGPKDVARKTTPYLVGWDVLDEDVRELDREAVQAIPPLLARVGYGIVRAD